MKPRLSLASRRLALWLTLAGLFSCDVPAIESPAVKKGEPYYVSIPLSYWVYQSDAKACGLPADKVKCEGNEDRTICFYAQGACERTYIAEAATDEKIVMFPNDAKCAGFTITGEWSVTVFASVEECRKAISTNGGLTVEKIYGTYGSKMILRRGKKVPPD